MSATVSIGMTLFFLVLCWRSLVDFQNRYKLKNS